MQVDIITPDKNIFSGEAKELLVPGTEGFIGILENHAPLISTLREGKVKVTDKDGKSESYEINGGVAEVLNNKVIILAE